MKNLIGSAGNCMGMVLLVVFLSKTEYDDIDELKIELFDAYCEKNWVNRYDASNSNNV